MLFILLYNEPPEDKVEEEIQNISHITSDLDGSSIILTNGISGSLKAFIYSDTLLTTQ